jgi:hypothetical protein
MEKSFLEFVCGARFFFLAPDICANLFWLELPSSVLFVLISVVAAGSSAAMLFLPLQAFSSVGLRFSVQHQAHRAHRSSVSFAAELVFDFRSWDFPFQARDLFPLACASSFDPSSCPDFSFAPVRSHIKASQSFLFVFYFSGTQQISAAGAFGFVANGSRAALWICSQRLRLRTTSVHSRFVFLSFLCAGNFWDRSGYGVQFPPPSLLLVLLATTAPVRLAPLSFCCSKYCCGLCVTSCLCYFLQLAGFFRAFALNRALVFDFYAAGSSFDCCC